MAATQEKPTPAHASDGVVGAKAGRAPRPVQEWVTAAVEKQASVPPAEAVSPLIAPVEDVQDPPAKPSSRGDDFLDLLSSFFLRRREPPLRTLARGVPGLTQGNHFGLESPNLLQCGRNNHDGYEKSILGNPSSTEKALSIINIRRMPEASLWRIFTQATKHLSIKSLKKMTFTLLVVLLKLLEGFNDDGMSLGGPLIDILNITGDCMNMNQLSNEKRRPGKMNYVSPFKRPHSSLLRREALLFWLLVHPSHQQQKVAAVMVKCCITQSGSLPHEVSNMDADNAVTYRFYDASHHDEIGLEAFQVMLLKSGASSSNATKSMEAIVEDANLATPSSGSNILSSELNATQQPLLIAKEFAALKSTDDRLQVSFSDGDLRAFPDNQREVMSDK
ncbi:BRCA2, helical [Musa troglodytarum]|uniref:BRCA2, helical n=2 Tax=Musa troglodytarum TaxID=320322 RepID=A0A9E7HDX7_9LILI|nr:BRCA2, helical [Musa troglodytarum]